MGYQSNEYDWYVTNTIIDDKQFTLLQNVNDLKTSHDSTVVVFSVLSDIDAGYGEIAKMTITRGKVHKYLAMSINYPSSSDVIFSMVDYNGKILEDIPGEMTGESATHATQ